MKIRQEIENYATTHGTKTAIDQFLKIYAKFSLKKTTVNARKEKFLDQTPTLLCFTW